MYAFSPISYTFPYHCAKLLQSDPTLWTIVHQAPLSVGFSRQECWSGLPCPPPGHLPNPAIKPTSPVSPALQKDSLLLSYQGSPNSIISEMKVTQSRLTRCDPMDYPVHGILQARILEWVAFAFSRGSFQPRDRTQISLITCGFFTSWATREALGALLCTHLISHLVVQIYLWDNLSFHVYSLQNNSWLHS